MMKRIFGLISLTLLLAIAGFADVRIPDRLMPTPAPTPSATPRIIEKDAEMEIVISHEVTEPTLIVNKDLFRKYTSENVSGGIGSTQTIVGGLFLSLAIVFGGVWLARGKVRMPKTAIGASAAVFLCLAGTIAYANIPPPRPLNKKLFTDEGSFPRSVYSKGDVKVRLSDEDDPEIRLLIPAKDAKPK